MNPIKRKVVEEQLLKEYYNSLINQCENKNLINEYTFEQCLNDYINGGVSRWVWLLLLLTSMCPDNMVQYFHDQLLFFIIDHNVTPENIEMPRV